MESINTYHILTRKIKNPVDNFYLCGTMHNRLIDFYIYCTSDKTLTHPWSIHEFSDTKSLFRWLKGRINK